MQFFSHLILEVEIALPIACTLCKIEYSNQSKQFLAEFESG